MIYLEVVGVWFVASLIVAPLLGLMTHTAVERRRERRGR